MTLKEFVSGIRPNGWEMCGDCIRDSGTERAAHGCCPVSVRHGEPAWNWKKCVPMIGLPMWLAHLIVAAADDRIEDDERLAFARETTWTHESNMAELRHRLLDACRPSGG